MNIMLSAVLEDSAVKEMRGCFQRKKGAAFVYGLAGAHKHSVLAACHAADSEKKSMVIVTRDMQQAREWWENLHALLPDKVIMELPVVDMADFNRAASSLELMSRRMDILGKLLRGEPIIVVASADAAAQRGLSRRDFERLSISLHMGDEVEISALAQQLSQLGYQREQQVDMAGQFSIRGGIVDVYPINAVEPVRIEFFDNEIDSIRHFSLETQRSVKTVSSLEIMPFAVESKAGSGGRGRKAATQESFLSYVPESTPVIFDEPLRIRDQILKLVKENPEVKGKLASWEELQEGASNHNVIYLALLLQKIHGSSPDALISITVQAVTSYSRQMDMLASDVQEWLSQGKRIMMMVSNKDKSTYMRNFFGEKRLPSVELTGDATKLRTDAVSILQGDISHGFELPGARLVVVTEKDVFGHQKKRIIRTSKEQRISHFREIKEGDYVVHINHGIGKYVGVKTLEIDGIHKDYLHIKYGGEDKLYLPVDQVHMLQKYIGAEGAVPELHRMDGGKWSRQVSKAKKAVEDIAEELIALYAARQKAKGYAFSPDTAWQHEFEESFPYQETDDQLTAIAAIKADMEKPQPMDRLLCGDVGFGKTEVAIRAAFKAVMDGKQVAVLVPTTVLAQQHYQTFSERFRNFGPTVDLINKFRTAKEQRETLANLEMGMVDIIIGTHALLNTKRIKFKDLGLLVVDEEQRFGVRQKEKIKKLATGIDVLTLSATPIPRTLHMSLTGTRDMSIIETAPAERFPVQSYVVEDDDGILRNAIRRELKRDGQIYFVHNRVENIELVRNRIQELAPEARIEIGHGQMPEEELERVMMDFYEHKFDILLATTIIENGLDLPNANTIIVHDADRFGLSQLYQMRGRVGRSNRMAYAYFVYQENKVLTETAEKRLQAIKEFAELGAGFKIAMRDLEIRGAGNILGSQQHGHIASVGFEMYCHLLETAMEQLKTGNTVKILPEPVIEVNVDAYLDSDYISDPMHKIEIYQRIAAVRNQKDLEQIIDDLIDRFGEPPAAVMNLLAVARIKNYARNLGIKSIAKKIQYLEVSFLSAEEQKESGRTFNPQNMLVLLSRLGSGAQIIGRENILRVKLTANYQAKIMGLLLGIVKILAGEKVAKKKK